MCAILQFMSLEPTERQLLRLLWDLAERPPAAAGAGPDAAADVAPIAIAPLCQTRLARALAVDRKTIARNLKRLIASGALRPVMLEGKKRHAALLVDRRARGTSTPTGTFRRSAMTWRLSSIERYRAS